MLVIGNAESHWLKRCGVKYLLIAVDWIRVAQLYSMPTFLGLKLLAMVTYGVEGESNKKWQYSIYYWTRMAWKQCGKNKARDKINDPAHFCL